MKENRFEFSVLIACYKPDLEKLKKTINSVVNQKNVTYEIIVADDGTQFDYKNEVIEYFQKIGFENYKLSFLEENRGTVCNILEGIKLSEAQYVKTISPGDYFYDENSLSEYLKVFKTKNADLVFGRAQFYTPEFQLLASATPNNSKVYKNRSLKRCIVSYHDYVLGATVAAKRDLYDCLNGFVGKVKYTEDLPLTYLALLDGKRVFATNKKVVWYEYGLGVSTDKSTSPLIQQDIDVFFAYLEEHYKKEAKLSLKFYRIMKEEGRGKKIFKKLIASPLYFFHAVHIRIYKQKFMKNEINGLYRITKIQDSDL